MYSNGEAVASGLGLGGQSAVLPGPTHTQFQPHSALVPANPYLQEEIPPWLLVYVNGE